MTVVIYGATGDTMTLNNPLYDLYYSDQTHTFLIKTLDLAEYQTIGLFCRCEYFIQFALTEDRVQCPHCDVFFTVTPNAEQPGSVDVSATERIKRDWLTP